MPAIQVHLLFVLFLFGAGLGKLSAQYPSAALFMQHATEVSPGVWVADHEVSIRSYAQFLHFMIKDSGEAMYQRLLPDARYRYLGRAEVGHPYEVQPVDPLPVEAGHPIVGIDHRRAMAYCEWLTQMTNRMKLEELGLWEAPFVRFRLPSPEEWRLAAGLAQAPRRKGGPRELPSRFLHTCATTSARPGEKGLHFHDNVSEMTAYPQVVMGGSFDNPGLGQAPLSGITPDLRMGFRIALEIADSAKEVHRGYSRQAKKAWDEMFETRGFYSRNRDPDTRVRSAFYPFDLERACIEISPGIWITRHEVRVEEFAHALFYIERDSGYACAAQLWPASAHALPERDGNWTSLAYQLPRPGHLPLQGLDHAQIKRYCDWMSIHHRRMVSYPANVIRFWFRPVMAEDWTLAQRRDPAIRPAVDGGGFRYVVEVMPDHPDTRHFKEAPRKQFSKAELKNPRMHWQGL